MPTYDPAKTYEWKPTAFPFTEAESVPATMTEAAVAAAGIATEETLLLVKAKTDLIPADPATVTKQNEIIEAVTDKTGYSLAATGLDAIADPDDLTPESVPTTFSQKLRWLIQRFWKAEKSATAITVTNEAGDTITSQPVTSSGANETLGAPE